MASCPIVILNMKPLLIVLPLLIPLISPTWAWAAEPVINLHCGQTACVADMDVSSDQRLVWAPGMSFARTIKVFNDTTVEKSVSAGVSAVTIQALNNSQLTANWKNGSHKILWQGGLSELTKGVNLGTIPTHQSRVYYFDLALSKDLGNSAHGSSATFKPWVTVTDSAQTSSLTNNPNTSNTPKITSSVKGVSTTNPVEQLLHFSLPNLTSTILEQKVVDPLSNASTTLVQAARRQTWLVWAVLMLEVVALKPWSYQKVHYLEPVAVGGLAMMAAWLVAGAWWAVSLAGLLLILRLIGLTFTSHLAES